MLDYAGLLAVSLVIREGSFDRAARVLNVTPSAVSQRVKQVEERLGGVLIVRGQPCRATVEGEAVHRHMESLGILERDLMAHLPAARQGEADWPTLALATPADSLGTWFLGAVAAFAREERFLLDIAVDDQEHTAEWLRQGRVLAAVTALADPVQGCRSTSLGSLRYVATASPAFRNRHFPEGVTAEALSRAPALTYNRKDGLQAAWITSVLGRALSGPTHWLPSTQGFVEAALLGMGWGLNPLPLVAEALAEGCLVELIPGHVLDTPLHWQARRLSSELLPGLEVAVVRAGRAALVQGG
ncbi:MAG: LysR family transcriptional regulator ArgP [Rhodospirillum sp.]|nr:LysR family transcriptional regulator ArgP [Rhodospirillum sp.]MCF8488022.1 LysR family transcriptional regulator ArgP [Rhodospirillum sp.]MCF8500289.1 LysR family transcriptional regulator ArgP [Rhodospirillum sp.]